MNLINRKLSELLGYTTPKQHLPVLGYTVAQSEYDALRAECDRAHVLNARLQNESEQAVMLREDAMARCEALKAENERLRRALENEGLP